MLRQRTGSITRKPLKATESSESSSSRALHQELLGRIRDFYASLIHFPVTDYPIRWPTFILETFFSIVLFLLPARVEMMEKQITEKRRVLFVVNHNLWSLDIFTLYAVIWKKTGVLPRALADRMHFRLPVWGHFCYYILNFFEGTRENCTIAMKNSYPLIVFPGGAKEVFRKTGYERYSLEWGNRAGFATMALMHGYDMIPVAQIGMDDCFIPIGDVWAGWYMWLIGDKRTDLTVPVIVPKSFERQYLRIGAPIETKNMEFNDENVQKLRDLLYKEVTGMIEDLKRVRDKDPQRYILPPLSRD